MKRVIISVLVAITATMTYAQGDALKQILKAKTYEEAENLLQSNLSTLDAAQKAKAYNKLVDFAMKKVQEEETTIGSNQLKEQMKQEGLEPYDTLGYYNAIYTAIKNGVECEKYDSQPNAKGKVSPKFREANRNRLKNVRLNLINGGQYIGGKGDSKAALENFKLYVESSSSLLFANEKGEKEYDQYLGEVARVAAVYSYQEKNYDDANKYCDVALADSASHKDAIALKVYIMQTNLTNHEDSLAALNKMLQLYETEKDEQVFNSIVNMYGGLKMSDKQLEVITQRIAMDPNNFTAWALKGENEMNAGKWDACIEDFKKALSIDNTNPLVYTYVGFALNAKAAELATEAEQEAIFKESLTYLEKAKELDPNREKTNWSYPLYQCYYSLYGPDDSRTKEMEALVRN